MIKKLRGKKMDKEIKVLLIAIIVLLLLFIGGFVGYLIAEEEATHIVFVGKQIEIVEKEVLKTIEVDFNELENCIVVHNDNGTTIKCPRLI